MKREREIGRCLSRFFSECMPRSACWSIVHTAYDEYTQHTPAHHDHYLFLYTFYSITGLDSTLVEFSRLVHKSVVVGWILLVSLLFFNILRENSPLFQFLYYVGMKHFMPSLLHFIFSRRSEKNDNWMRKGYLVADNV
jgi:hypothetical protein